jgi:D-alanine-D-alanine ligase
MTTKNIALLAGGYSGEYEVSIKSAKYIAQNIKADKYKVFTILISREKWVYVTETGAEVPVDKNDFSITLGGEKINFAFAFITVHGTPGEDGKLQGYFDMIGIPYNTCDATTSAITMNKAYTKAIVQGIEGLHTAKSMQLFHHNDVDLAAVVSRLKFPLFIKPNNGGSSVGMSKVHNIAGLDEALQKAFAEDKQILVEEFIQGREFSIGIVNLDGDLKVLPATEIISSKEFFDFEAKYTAGMSEEITPANLGDEQNKTIAHIVKDVYLRLNCHGMTRLDFILQESTGNFYFIEINTTPGQTEASLIPQQVRAAGMDIVEFYDKLIKPL